MIMIIPCCGRSERYGDLMKQFLPHPTGVPLPMYSASGILGVEKKYFIFLKDEFWKHFDLHHFDGEVVLLRQQTNSQVETILEALKYIPYAEGGLYIKDCDNFFIDVARPGIVSVVEADDSKFNVNNKSYSLGKRILELHERQKISRFVNVGGYGFKSVEHFYYYAQNQSTVTGVINSAISDGHMYFQSLADEYIDYGEYADWKNYLKQYYAPTIK